MTTIDGVEFDIIINSDTINSDSDTINGNTGEIILISINEFLDINEFFSKDNFLKLIC